MTAHCPTCACGCTCGYGGLHEPLNPRCALNTPASIAKAHADAERETEEREAEAAVIWGVLGQGD